MVKAGLTRSEKRQSVERTDRSQRIDAKAVRQNHPDFTLQYSHFMGCRREKNQMFVAAKTLAHFASSPRA